MPAIDQQERVEAEPALVRAADDVGRAKVDIRELLGGDTQKIWTIRQVQDNLTGWRGTIIHLALLDMSRSGEIEMGDDLAIRVVALRSS